MGIDATKTCESKKQHHDMKLETAHGITGLIEINVKPTSHEKQIRVDALVEVLVRWTRVRQLLFSALIFQVEQVVTDQKA